MRVQFSVIGWEEYEWWCRQGAKALLRVNELINDIRRHPFDGIGKPEPLKGDLKGFWSRRINDRDRLVYQVSGVGEAQSVIIAMCRYHY